MKQKNEKKKTVSIKAKLLGIILPVVVVIIVLLVAVSYSVSKQIITERSQNLLKSSIENQVGEIESWLDENLSAFMIVKQTIEGTKPSDSQLQAMLNSYYGFNANYSEGLYIANSKGELIKAESSEKSGGNVTESVWYKDGLTRVNMGFTNAYTNEKGEEVISASGMLRGDEVRVISADLSLQRISIIVNSFIEMEDAQAFLVNTEDDTILAHRDNSLISSKVDVIDDKFMKGVAEKIAQQDYTLVEIAGNMTAFEEVQGTDWILVSYIPTDIIYEDVNGVRTSMILIGVVSVLFLAVLIERVVHVVIKPVKELTGAIVAMTDGDFTIKINAKSNDEIGVMGRCVEKFVVSMRDMIASIHGVSKKLHTQADNSNEVSGEMYDASKLQSHSMQELNTTVEQLSLSVNEIADNATTLAMVVAETREDSDKVDEKMKETVEASSQGKSDMQNVGTAMQNINDSVLKLQQAIDKVGKASEEITNITGVIGSIAEETNLLSLNASIEAARAGEAGKGFAVVATEIGKLAQTSADSVQNIEQLISEINVLVNDAVGQADDSVENINSSSRLVSDTLKTFDIIFRNIDDVSNLVQQMIHKVEKVDDVASNVAAISEEQAASAEVILTASDMMVEQANNITGNSESVANEAKELTASAEELANQVKVFRIE
ncbi:MAG: HAMP domain-containing protein [Lachnospiraceae bacterium]|nr:HAMP domain-containing protein [Lachnospiraceae bacterium]